METPLTPNVTSFVIRFVIDGPEVNGFRGTIRHVQTDEEISFTKWDDAVTFIQRFVPLGGSANLTMDC